ncbi:MAG: hypothetical protein QE285_19045 [Aquabacterium sp.]|nr:hypothetical protein [Aquabacterium sp.]
MTALPQQPVSVHLAAGLSADGAALGDGAARDALHQAMRQLSDAELVEGSHRAPAMCQALTEAARALADLHAYGPAESHLALALRWAVWMGGHDLSADLHCAWAEVAANAADLADAQGEPARCRAARDWARHHAVEAARLAGLATDPHWEIRLLLRASDVLDRCGDHGDSVLLQQRALVLMGLGQADLPAEAGLGAGPAHDSAPLTAPGVLM